MNDKKYKLYKINYYERQKAGSDNNSNPEIITAENTMPMPDPIEVNVSPANKHITPVPSLNQRFAKAPRCNRSEPPKRVVGGHERPYFRPSREHTNSNSKRRRPKSGASANNTKSTQIQA